MTTFFRFVISCFSFFCLMGATSPDIYPFDSPQKEKRFYALTETIRCVVCQNQTIADSNAPLAKDLRKKIYDEINANQTDEAIKQYLQKRYGDFILFNPPFNSKTALLWLFPVLSVLLIGLFLITRYRRHV